MSMITADGQRGVRRLAAVLVVWSALAGCGPTPHSRTHQYHSAEYGYSLRLPSGWGAIPAKHWLASDAAPRTANGGVDIIAARPSIRVSEMSTPALVIGAQHLDRPMSSAEWADQVVGIVEEMKQCARPDHRDPIAVGATNGILLTYNDCPEELAYYHLWVTVAHRGVAYQIVFFDQQGNEVANRAQFEAILTSLRLDEERRRRAA